MKRLIAGVLLVVAITASAPVNITVDSPTTSEVDSGPTLTEGDDDEPEPPLSRII